MANNQNETSLLNAIEEQKENIAELTCQLINIPTVNPPGENYLEICNFLQKRLRKNGFETKLIRAEGGLGDSDEYPRWNLIAQHDAGLKGDCIHFNSHTDVVASGQGWTVEPFKASIKNGKVYGRGACDMKGGLATSIVAAETFTKLYPNHKGKIEISATADEESGGFSGVAFLAKKGFFNPQKVQHVIIPEPLNKNRICLGHRGVWWAEIETNGRIAHGSMPFLGDCAVRHMAAVLKEMEETLFPLLLNRKSEMPVVPDGAKCASLNINSIYGGAKEMEEGYTGLPAACVPDSCKITIDRRFLIEENIEDVKSEIFNLMERVKESRPSFKYQINELFEVQPTMTEKTSTIVKVVAQSIKKIMQINPKYVVSPGTYDQKHIDRIGQLKNCIAYGPGILDLAHQPDEWVGIDDMVQSCKVMGLSISELLN